MKTLAEILKWIAGVLLAILAPLLVIVIGALMVGAGIYKDWQWLTYSGIFLAVLGLGWITYHWSDTD